MRNTIIPAQITTVEDKIAGSFNMAQILILMIPVLWTTLVYALFFPAMKIVIYKLVLVFIVTTICVILVIRIKEKIIASWLLIIIKYRLRPKYYLFNKNNLNNRIVDVPEITEEIIRAKKPIKVINQNKVIEADFLDLVKLEHLVDIGRVTLNYQFENKKQ
jgi:hypothetical protein